MKRLLLALPIVLGTTATAHETEVPVNIDTFIRAETDTYLRQR